MKVTIEFTKPQPIKALKSKAQRAKETGRKVGQSFKAAAQGFRKPWQTPSTST